MNEIRLLPAAIAVAMLAAVGSAVTIRRKPLRCITAENVYRRNASYSIRCMQNHVAHLTGVNTKTICGRHACDLGAALGFFWLNHCNRPSFTLRDLQRMVLDISRSALNGESSVLETVLLHLSPTRNKIDSFVLYTLAAHRYRTLDESSAVLAELLSPECFHAEPGLRSVT